MKANVSKLQQQLPHEYKSKSRHVAIQKKGLMLNNQQFAEANIKNPFTERHNEKMQPDVVGLSPQPA